MNMDSTFLTLLFLAIASKVNTFPTVPTKDARTRNTSTGNAAQGLLWTNSCFENIPVSSNPNGLFPIAATAEDVPIIPSVVFILNVITFLLFFFLQSLNSFKSSNQNISVKIKSMLSFYDILSDKNNSFKYAVENNYFYSQPPANLHASFSRDRRVLIGNFRELQWSIHCKRHWKMSVNTLNRFWSIRS